MSPLPDGGEDFVTRSIRRHLQVCWESLKRGAAPPWVLAHLSTGGEASRLRILPVGARCSRWEREKGWAGTAGRYGSLLAFCWRSAGIYHRLPGAAARQSHEWTRRKPPHLPRDASSRSCSNRKYVSPPPLPAPFLIPPPIHPNSGHNITS